METIKLSKNNFWIKLSKLFINYYPDNTCSLRKTLLLGLSLLFLFPLLILATNIADEKENEEFDLGGFIILLAIGAFFSFIPFVLFFGDVIANFTLNMWSFLATWYVLGPLSMWLLTGIVYLIIIGLFKLGSLVRFEPKHNKSNIISELYQSAKEKYCKKIIIQ